MRNRRLSNLILIDSFFWNFMKRWSRTRSILREILSVRTTSLLNHKRDFPAIEHEELIFVQPLFLSDNISASVSSTFLLTTFTGQSASIEPYNMKAWVIVCQKSNPLFRGSPKSTPKYCVVHFKVYGIALGFSVRIEVSASTCPSDLLPVNQHVCCYC